MPKVISRHGLIRELDRVFSILVRERDDWKCFRCGTQYTPPTRALHNSHYFSRRYNGTRWDFKNCDSACYGCHRYLEGDKQGWYKEYKISQLGEQEFQYLQMRAYGITKYSYDDLEMTLELLKQLLKDLPNRKYR